MAGEGGHGYVVFSTVRQDTAASDSGAVSEVPSRLTSCDRLPSGAALRLALVDDATGIMSVASDDFKL